MQRESFPENGLARDWSFQELCIILEAIQSSYLPFCNTQPFRRTSGEILQLMTIPRIQILSDTNTFHSFPPTAYRLFNRTIRISESVAHWGNKYLCMVDRCSIVRRANTIEQNTHTHTYIQTQTRVCKPSELNWIPSKSSIRILLTHPIICCNYAHWSKPYPDAIFFQITVLAIVLPYVHPRMPTDQCTEM